MTHCRLCTPQAAAASLNLALAEPDAFHPSPDASMVDYMRSSCRHLDQSSSTSAVAAVWSWLVSWGRGVDGDFDRAARRRRAAACDRLAGFDFGQSRDFGPASFAVHHWTHSWVGRRNDPWGLLNEHAGKFDVAAELTAMSNSSGGASSEQHRTFIRTVP